MLAIRNRQRVRHINTRLLRQIIITALAELEVSPDSELCFHLVNAQEMARLNWQFLQHQGSTDVITFDHSKAMDSPTSTGGFYNDSRSTLHGEIFICVADAVTQAKEFRTNWQAELVRYAVHGLLHLLGHDDLKPAARRKMKQAENRIVRQLAKQFPLACLAR